jgi:hypothetical protein
MGFSFQASGRVKRTEECWNESSRTINNRSPRAAAKTKEKPAGVNLQPAVANKPHQVEHPPGANIGRKAIRAFAATLILLVSSAAAAQECKSCAEADACIQTYLKAASEAQRATKVAFRDWQQNLDKKTSAEFSSRGMAALENVMVLQVRAELDRLKECLAKIK